MTAPTITGLEFGDKNSDRHLLLGPSLGTSAASLWGNVADAVSDDWHVLAWDLPGHGTNHDVPTKPFTLAGLTRGVLDLADATWGSDATFTYAGDSVGGAVALQLLIEAPERVEAAAGLCTGAKIGTPDGWVDRAARVRANGTEDLVELSRERWFGPGFTTREPIATSSLLSALKATDDEGYALVCEALAAFDIRSKLASITTPLWLLAGVADVATPPDTVGEVAAAVPHADYRIIPGLGHLAPVEAPAVVTGLIAELGATRSVH